MAARKTVLVFGATGKQGGAVIQHLLEQQSNPPLDIVAVTRSKASHSAQALASKPNVSVVEGNLDDPSAIFQQLPSVWGVFSVQVNSDAEEKQGKAVVDAAVANGVQHLVYSSGDRGGPDRSAKDPTPVKNFAAKFNIEKHLEQCAASSSQGMTYTILRPVTFFENLVPGMHGKGFARMWEQVGDKRLQMISTKDIGWFAAQALLRPEEYRNQAETLAGDELNHKEAAAIFLQVTGRPMELAPCPVGSALKFFKPETLGSMFQWFKYAGYNANVEACRKAYPKMQDYPTWLRQSSGFAKSI